MVSRLDDDLQPLEDDLQTKEDDLDNGKWPKFVISFQLTRID